MDRQPTLKGERLLLRPLEAHNWDALFAVASDPLIWEVHPAHDRWQEPVFRAFFADALAKVSPQVQTKAKATAQDFEAMFLNSMFSQMTSGLKGEGPFGDTTGTGIWRSKLTEEYSKNFAKASGVGISNDVYRTLILQQANRAG